MPTVNTLVVAPSGGDYTTLTAAFGDPSIPADLVAADEQWVFEIQTFSGGLVDSVVVPTTTTDATRNFVIRAAAGHEYNPVDDTGAYLQKTAPSARIFDNQNVDHTLVENLGFINTGTSSPVAIRDQSDSSTYNNVYCRCTDDLTPDSSVFFARNATNLKCNNVLTVGGNDGFDIGNFTSAELTNCTVINPASFAYDIGTSGAGPRVLINCLHIDGAGGSSTFLTGTTSQSSSDYNATSDSTSPPGANSLANRTTSDLADYLNSDYRTDSASALATAGDGVNAAYIGYDLETVAGGVSGSVDFSVTKPTFAITGIALGTIDANIDFTVIKPAFTVTGEATIPQPDASIAFTVAEPEFTVTGFATQPGFAAVVTIVIPEPDFAITADATLPQPDASVNFSVSKPEFAITGRPAGTISVNLDFLIKAPKFSIWNRDDPTACQHAQLVAQPVGIGSIIEQLEQGQLTLTPQVEFGRLVGDQVQYGHLIEQVELGRLPNGYC